MSERNKNHTDSLLEMGEMAARNQPVVKTSLQPLVWAFVIVMALALGFSLLMDGRKRQQLTNSRILGQVAQILPPGITDLNNRPRVMRKETHLGYAWYIAKADGAESPVVIYYPKNIQIRSVRLAPPANIPRLPEDSGLREYEVYASLQHTNGSIVSKVITFGPYLVHDPIFIGLETDSKSAVYEMMDMREATDKL